MKFNIGDKVVDSSNRPGHISECREAKYREEAKYNVYFIQYASDEGGRWQYEYQLTLQTNDGLVELYDNALQLLS